MVQTEGLLSVARFDAEEAIRLDPGNVKSYSILSQSLMKGQLFQEALEVCTQNEMKMALRCVELEVADCQYQLRLT